MKSVDALIVGAGAAGCTLAFKLARRGRSVVLLEKGPRHNPTQFRQNEFYDIPNLYKNGGIQSSKDRSINILQGSGVGGSTVINNAIWIRPDLEKLLADWRARGANIDRRKLESAYQELEGWLHIGQIPSDMANKGTQFLQKGDTGLTLLNHNRDTCIGCGFCNFGCKYNRKLSGLITFVPWAEELGAQVHDTCGDVEFRHSNGVINEVSFDSQGIRQLVHPEKVIVTCGAIGTSELLLRNGIDRAGLVGKAFHLLGGAYVTAVSSTPLNAFDLIGLSARSEAQYGERVTETFFAPPGAFAVGLGGWGEDLREKMEKYTHTAQAGVMVATHPTGKISIAGRRVNIDVNLSSDRLTSLKEGLKRLCRLYLDAGATEVWPSTFQHMRFTKESDVSALDDAVKGVEDLIFGSAHPQGGNAMSDDACEGVVNSEFRVHDFENLFVADASVFPTNLWANCQATTMAMASLASDSIFE